MANHTFDDYMKNTVSNLNERAAAAGLIDLEKERYVYRVGSPTYGNGHYLAIKENENGGEHQVMYFPATVNRESFRHAVSAYSHVIDCTTRAAAGAKFWL